MSDSRCFGPLGSYFYLVAPGSHKADDDESDSDDENTHRHLSSSFYRITL